MLDRMGVSPDWTPKKELQSTWDHNGSMRIRIEGFHMDWRSSIMSL